MKPVGILGGMGPAATVLLMQRVMAAVQAQDDSDHIPLIVHQNPQVPSRLRWLIDQTGENPGLVLAQMAKDLATAGAQALAMPCNTAHAFAPAIINATPLPLLDMRTVTISSLIAHLPKGAQIGLLASPALRQAGAFDGHISDAGFTAIWPKDEGPTLALIRRVKAGAAGQAEHDRMAALAADMATQTDHLLIACTELSLLTSALPPAGWTDSLDCLVNSIVGFSANRGD